MDVILLIDNFPKLSKSIINKGEIPTTAIKIVNFLRAIFLLSNSLLNRNNFFIFIPTQFSFPPFGLLVLFNGSKLRYLAPDEREILFLLLKIHKILTGEGGKKQEKREAIKFRNMEKAQSTPGIFLKRGHLESFLEMYPSDGKKYVFFDTVPNNCKVLHSWDELFNIITTNAVLVFSENQNTEFLENDSSQLYAFHDQSWKAKFYESELISYLQTKIVQ